jgi:hypothetical protein
MKKLLTLASVLALAACGQPLDVAQHDADFEGCERVDTTKIHLVYKCPASMERFAEIKTQEPTALFKMGGSLNWDEVNADTEHVYVEVVKPHSENCKENFHYRTMVKPFNQETQEWYAVVSCKTPAEVKAEEPKAEEPAAK